MRVYKCLEMAEMKKEETKKEDPIGKPVHSLFIEVEETGAGIEKFYFWIIKFLESTQPSGLSAINGPKFKVEKIKDIFSASETSAFFGSIEQRKGLQQEKVSQYMATLGRMTRDLFQIVRELRIIDERLTYYNNSEDRKRPDWEDSEIALKSIWIDLVEGGSKNPGSVLGLGSQVGFVILPDLFFTIHPEKVSDVKTEISGGEGKYKNLEGINRKVREVLRRKLWQYLTWKETTGKEIRQRKSFVLKFLRQHYNVMRMYITWLKPYLRNIKRLQSSQENYPEIVAAFDTSKIELEILAKKVESEKQEVFPCIIVKFDYVSIPQMAYQQEFQRGALHVGDSKIIFEAYALTQKQIEAYKKKIEDEDLELIASVYESMESLKDDLKNYLEQEGEKWFKKDEEVKKEEKKNILTAFFSGITEGFSNVSKGFSGIFSIKLKSMTEKEESHWSFMDAKKKAEDEAKLNLWILYDVFKKAHRMVTW